MSRDNDVFNRLLPSFCRAAEDKLWRWVHKTMQCIHCGHEETRVIETRQTGEDVRRRRECPACSQRFTTYERVERQPIRIVKRDGSRELFDYHKLKRGILLSCEKRPITEEQIDVAVGTVERLLRESGETEVPSKVVGDLVMVEIRKLDQVAYIRFASVYKEFTDVKSFEKEIKVLTRGK